MQIRANPGKVGADYDPDFSSDYYSDVRGGLSMDFTDPADLASFVGNGVFDITQNITLNLEAVVGTEGDGYLSMYHGAGVFKNLMSLRYNYEPSTSVPDASIILLLGSSLMGLAVFSKKSKRIG